MATLYVTMQFDLLVKVAPAAAAAESEDCSNNFSSSCPMPVLLRHLIHICWLTLILMQFTYY